MKDDSRVSAAEGDDVASGFNNGSAPEYPGDLIIISVLAGLGGLTLQLVRGWPASMALTALLVLGPALLLHAIALLNTVERDKGRAWRGFGVGAALALSSAIPAGLVGYGLAEAYSLLGTAVGYIGAPGGVGRVAGRFSGGTAVFADLLFLLLNAVIYAVPLLVAVFLLLALTTATLSLIVRPVVGRVSAADTVGAMVESLYVTVVTSGVIVTCVLVLLRGGLRH